MKISLHHIKVSELVDKYQYNEDEAITAYGGKLDIRPAYQRNFVYPLDKQVAVIETILKGYPLNIMYWVVKDDGTYEILDGQQRTMSICQYVGPRAFLIVDENGIERYFHNLTPDKQQKILDYELMVYFCEGTPSEKIDWFHVVNIGGEVLTNQELLNSIYTGPWLYDAKKHFSKRNCAAYLLSKDYIKVDPNRQELLELALKWINNGNVKGYMAEHQEDVNASALWVYFQKVINWIKITFPQYWREMKGLPWGEYYNEYGDNVYDPSFMQSEVARLMADEEVENNKGIFKYLLSKEPQDIKERYLHLRAFDTNMARKQYEKQGGICPMCVAAGREKTHYEFEEMEADHIKPWSLGGRTEEDNCQMLCVFHNRHKGADSI